MDKVFWPLLSIALIFLFVSTTNFLLISVAILFVLVAITWMKLSDTHWEVTDFKEKMTDYLERLEVAVLDKLADQDHGNPIQVSNMNEGEFLDKDHAEEKFDRMAKKMIDVENKLTKTKRTLATAFAALDDRLRSIEEELTILRPETEK